MKINAIAAGIVAAGLMTASAANAGTVNLEQTFSGTGSILDVFGAPSDALYDDVKINFDGSNKYVYAGAFQVTETGTTNDWLAFCVDIAQYYHMPASFDMDPALFGTDVVTRLDKLFTNYFDDVTTDNTAAAFQVAIWEVVSDTALDLADGKFLLRSGTTHLDNINGAIKTTAQGFLTGLDGLTGGAYDLTFLQNDDYQDLIVADPSPVPLPAGGLLLLAGLGAFGVARRAKS